MEKITEMKSGGGGVLALSHRQEMVAEGNNGLRGNSSVRTAETLLRLFPMALCVTAMVIMLKNAQNNDFGSVSYSDLGGFRYLVYANGICAGYSFLTAFFTAVNRSSTVSHTWSLFFLDQVMTYVILAAGAVSAEVLYLAENGDTAITWSETCGVFGGFCKKAKMSTVITFGTMACYALLSLLSSYRLFSNYDAPINYPCNKALEMPVFSN